MFVFNDYVGFETAKLLKEKGFNAKIDTYYSNEGDLFIWSPNEKKSYLTNEGVETWWWKCIAPTLQMAMKWLREEHNLAISTSVTVDGWRSYVSQIKLDSCGFVVDIIDGIDGGNIPNCDTYEDACEAAIKYCLENLI